MAAQLVSDVVPSDISVSLFTGNVHIAGHAIDLTARDFVLLAHLAWVTRPVTPETLEALLWPARAGGARNNLQVHVYRLRTALGGRETIRLTRDGYRLHEDVAVDLHAVRTSLADAYRADALSTAQREGLEATFARMSVGRPARVRRQPAFDAIEAALHACTLAVAKRLAIEAARVGRYDRALVYATIACDDETDAEARRILARSLGALGRLDDARVGCP